MLMRFGIAGVLLLLLIGLGAPPQAQFSGCRAGFCAPVVAAVGCSMAFDAVASASIASSTGTAPALSWTHTPVGVPTAVSVAFQYFGGAVSSVTYGGTSMTLGSNSGNDANGSDSAVWGLANPASGVQTVAINTNATSMAIEAGSITVTCSSISAAFDNAASSVGTSATPSVTVNSTAAEIVVDVVGTYTAAGTLSVTGTGQAVKWGTLIAGGNRAAGSTMPGGATTTTPAWSFSGGSTVFSNAAASFKHQ